MDLEELLAQIARLNEDSHGEALETSNNPFDVHDATPNAVPRPMPRFTLCSTVPTRADGSVVQAGSVCHTPTTAGASVHSYPSTPAVVTHRLSNSPPHVTPTKTPTHHHTTSVSTPSRLATFEDSYAPSAPAQSHSPLHYHTPSHPATPNYAAPTLSGVSPSRFTAASIAVTPPRFVTNATPPPRGIDGDVSPMPSYDVVAMSRDAQGSRVVQHALGGPWFSPQVQFVVNSLLPVVGDLLHDPYGATVVAALLIAAPSGVRSPLLRSIVPLAITPHSSAAPSHHRHQHEKGHGASELGVATLQHIVESSTSATDFSIAVDALMEHVEMLLNDPRAFHIVVHALARASHADGAIRASAARLLRAVVTAVPPVAMHRQGCCSLQKCLEWSQGYPKGFDALAGAIVQHVGVLATNQFGNYVVQLLLDKCCDSHHTEFRDRPLTTCSLGMGGNGAAVPLSDFTMGVASVVADHIVSLCCNKFSSNVVEKLIRLGGDAPASVVIRALIVPTAMASIAQNPFGNYVVQTALKEGPIAVLPQLIAAVKSAMPLVRSHHFSRKVEGRLEEAVERIRKS